MRVFDSERESCLQLVQLAVIIHLAVLIMRRKEQMYFPKPSQNMFELLLKVCWKSSRFWAVFGASQGKISSRQELEGDLTYRDTNERGFNDGASSM